MNNAFQQPYKYDASLQNSSETRLNLPWNDAPYSHSRTSSKNAPIILASGADWRPINATQSTIAAMPSGTKKKIAGIKGTQLGLRFVQVLAALGLTVVLVTMGNVARIPMWIMRIAPPIDAIVSIYAVYFLVPNAKTRVPGTSGAYNTFAAITDVIFVGLYAYIAYTVYENMALSSSSSSRWTSMLGTGSTADLLIQISFYGAVAIGGLHLLSTIFDIWMGVLFKKITKMPPDMNPLEDNLTSRAGGHKHTDSEDTYASDLKSWKYASTSTLSVDRASHLSPGKHDLPIPEVKVRSANKPPGVTSLDSNEMFSFDGNTSAQRFEPYRRDQPDRNLRPQQHQQMQHRAPRTSPFQAYQVNGAPARYDGQRLPYTAPAQMHVDTQQRQALLRESPNRPSQQQGPYQQRQQQPSSYQHNQHLQQQAQQQQYQFEHQHQQPQDTPSRQYQTRAFTRNISGNAPNYSQPRPHANVAAPPPQQQQPMGPNTSHQARPYATAMAAQTEHLRLGDARRTPLTSLPDLGNGMRIGSSGTLESAAHTTGAGSGDGKLQRTMTLASNTSAATEGSSVYSESAPSMHSHVEARSGSPSKEKEKDKGRKGYGELVSSFVSMAAQQPRRALSRSASKSQGKKQMQTQGFTMLTGPMAQGGGQNGGLSGTLTGEAAPKPTWERAAGRVASRSGADVEGSEVRSLRGYGLRSREVSGKVAEEGRGGMR